VSFDWNGITDGGQPAPPGKYQLKAEATVGGQNVAVNTLVKAHVESVTLGQGGTTLNLGTLGALDLNEVSEIF
jgi:flagellar basal-body rod modification protein FlgD